MDQDYEDNLSTLNTGYQVERRDSWRIMFEKLLADVNSLMSREKELVTTEVREKVLDIKRASVSMAIAGSLLFVGIFSLVATVIILMGKVMDLGLAAAIVTGVLFLAGAILFFYGKRKLTAENLTPRHSIDALGEMTNTFKEKYNEYKSNTHH